MYVNRFTLFKASPIHTQNQTSTRATPLPDPTDFLTPPLESERRRKVEVRIGEYSPVQSHPVQHNERSDHSWSMSPCLRAERYEQRFVRPRTIISSGAGSFLDC